MIIKIIKLYYFFINNNIIINIIIIIIICTTSSLVLTFVVTVVHCGVRLDIKNIAERKKILWTRLMSYLIHKNLVTPPGMSCFGLESVISFKVYFFFRRLTPVLLWN